MPAAISMEFFHLALLGSGMRATRTKHPSQLSPGTEWLPAPFLSSYIMPWVSPRPLDILTPSICTEPVVMNAAEVANVSHLKIQKLILR